MSEQKVKAPRKTKAPKDSAPARVESIGIVNPESLEKDTRPDLSQSAPVQPPVEQPAQPVVVETPPQMIEPTVGNPSFDLIEPDGTIRLFRWCGSPLAGDQKAPPSLLGKGLLIYTAAPIRTAALKDGERPDNNLTT